MADPITLATVGGALLTEGVKFLYEQAGLLIKRWTQKREPEPRVPEAAGVDEHVQVDLPKALGGGSTTVRIDARALATLIEPLKAMRKELSEAADGLVTPTKDDDALLGNIDAMRRMIEAIYQKRLDFTGEQRSGDVPTVTGSVNVQHVLGYVAAVRARVIRGAVNATATVDTVASTGQLVVVDADEIV